MLDAYSSEPQTSLERPRIFGIFWSIEWVAPSFLCNTESVVLYSLQIPALEKKYQSSVGVGCCGGTLQLRTKQLDNSVASEERKGLYIDRRRRRRGGGERGGGGGGSNADISNLPPCTQVRYIRQQEDPEGEKKVFLAKKEERFPTFN